MGAGADVPVSMARLVRKASWVSASADMAGGRLKEVDAQLSNDDGTESSSTSDPEADCRPLPII
jgi:hypothetical protein